MGSDVCWWEADVRTWSQASVQTLGGGSVQTQGQGKPGETRRAEQVGPESLPWRPGLATLPPLS